MPTTGKSWMWIGAACRVGRKRPLRVQAILPAQRNRRGRQLGHVLATRYEEVVDRLCDGTTILPKALQPLMEATEGTLDLDERERARTLVRIDACGRRKPGRRELASLARIPGSLQGLLQ